MELTMNQAVLGVERSGIRVFTQLARQTPGRMTLTLGEPDFDTAPAIRAAAKAALDQGDTHTRRTTAAPGSRRPSPILRPAAAVCPTAPRRSSSPWAPPRASSPPCSPS